MNESPQTVTHSLTSSRRLDQAIEYVARSWFPASPQALEKIQQRLEKRAYDNNFDLLYADLKSDFAIFTYLLKNIRTQYPKDQTILNPCEVLRSLDMETVLKLISVPSDAISSHSFAEMEKTQAARLKHLILGCTTTELIAPKDFNREQLFTTSVIRNLGLNLISWNYPSIYGRALQSVRDGAEDEFDEIISTQLGFRPIELAAALTLPEHAIRHYAEDLGLTIPSVGETNEPSMVRKLCEIGEAFAILNDPEHYPTGTTKSRTIIKEVNEILGLQARSLIVKTAKSSFVDYLAVSPQLAQEISIKSLSGTEKQNPYGKMLCERNPYFARLPTELKPMVISVYNTIKKGQVSTEGVQMLAGTIFPTLGFIRGCIYLIEQRELVLTPRLRIGKDSLNRYRAFSCIDPGLDSNPIVHAFSCSYPVRETGIVFLGERVSLIAGTLGVSERAGVLYAELEDDLASGTSYDALLLFRVLRQCFSDCLGLR